MGREKESLRESRKMYLDDKAAVVETLIVTGITKLSAFEALASIFSW
jgi:hypothetical protein